MQTPKENMNTTKAYRIIAFVDLLIILIVFGLVAAHLAQHTSIGFDIDFNTGLVMQRFVAHPDHGKVSLQDRVIQVNQEPVEQVNSIDLSRTKEAVELLVQSRNGTTRVVIVHPLPNTSFLLMERMAIPFMGLLFFLFGFCLVFLKTPHIDEMHFLMFGFFMGIFLILGPVGRSDLQWANSIYYFAVLTATWSFIEFHWRYLSVSPPQWLKVGYRLLKTLIIIAILVSNIYISTAFNRALDITWISDLIISFIMIILLFISQLFRREFRTGIVRTLFLSCLVAILPLIIFTYLPFIFNHPAYLPAIVVMAPVLILPLNYFVLLMNRKSWIKVSLVALSFWTSIFAEQGLVLAGNRLLPGGLPDYRVANNWFNYMMAILVLGVFLSLYYGIYWLYRRLIYGDVYASSRRLYRQEYSVVQENEIERPLILMGRSFMQEFYRYSYLNICLMDGTVMQFDEENQSTVIQFDERVTRDLVELLAKDHSLRVAGTLAERTVPISELERFRYRFPKIFGEEPRYCYLLFGSQGPIGFISAGDRKGGEPFDLIETRQLIYLLNQFQMMVDNYMLVEKIEQTSEQIRLSGQQMLQMRENERKRIARDMHDNIIQAITAFRFQLNELYDSEKLSIDDEEADGLQHNLLTITQDIRDIVFDLRPPALDATGLQSAIVSLVESYHARGNLSIAVQVEGEQIVNQLAEEVAICLYRVLQESLLNITKHADTRSAEVALLADETSVTMTVHDSGKGFSAPDRIGSLAQTGQFGLLGAQEFVETVNGEFSVDSSPGKGATIRAEIPLVREESSNGLFYDYRR